MGGRGGLDGAAGLVLGGRRGGGSTIVASNKTVLCIRSNFSSYLISRTYEESQAASNRV